jgi:DNA-binding SARP family transcriptional activator
MTEGFAISVRTLGAFQVTLDGKSVERWNAGKARNLLQFLLLHRNQTVSCNQLYNSLWPHASRATNSSSLKVAVHSLRKALDQAQSARGARDLRSLLQVSTCESGYRLDTHNVRVDYSEFESLIDQAHNAQRRSDLHLADELYTRASALYRGDFLPCVLDDWAATQREWLRSRQLFALRFLSERRLAQGDHLAVIDLSNRMLAIDSLYEPAYRMLISVHAELGHLIQVQRWYRLCVTRLREELQMAPEDETQHLYEQALRSRNPVRAAQL